MRTFWKMAPAKIAAIMLGLAATATLPACAPTYGYDYYGNDAPGGYAYGGAYYGADAYGYCDAYGCPADYWNLPIYYGSVYYDGAWLGGPLYYRDWGGNRQYWIRGGWHRDGWRGTRPSRYRMGHTGPALGLNWYRSHRVFRRNVHGSTYRDSYGGTRRYGYDRGAGNGRHGYGGHTANRPENRHRNSFTGRANRGEFRGLSKGGGHNRGAATPRRGPGTGHSGNAGGRHFGNSHSGGGHSGGHGGGHGGGGHR